jgi:hypothetical protein
MTDMAPLCGLRIQLNREIDKPCAACGRTIVVVGHDASLTCNNCKRPRGKLPASLCSFTLKAISLFGRPTEPFAIQTPTRPAA